jgi:signal transduction histidine kinase
MGSSAAKAAVWSALGALLATLLSTAAIAADQGGARSRERKTVLVLHGESRVTPDIFRIDETIRSQLGTAAPAVELFSEHLDLSWASGATYEARVLDYLKAKYEGRRIDLVVPVATTALRFALEHRGKLFPGAAIVFCAVDEVGAASLDLDRDVTGVLMVVDAAATLEAARRLQPDVRRAVVVGGASPLDRIFLENVRQDLARHPPGIEVSYLSGLPMAELRQTLASLSPQTAVLYVSLFRDGAGRTFVSPNAISELAGVSSAPGYGLSDTYLGRGVVGGRVVSFDAQGRQAVELIGRTLARQSGGPIPPIERGGNVNLFDWRELRRWGLDERRLPPGSILLHRDLSVWERDRWHVVGGASLIAAQAALIGVLMAQRARRRRAERSQSDRLRFEILLSDLSAMFADLPSREVRGGIGGALRRIGEHLGVDRATLTEGPVEPGPPRITHSWATAGGPPLPVGFDRDRFPWVAARIERGEVVRFSRLAELPDGAAEDRSSYAQLGVRSSVVIPLVARDTVMGTLTFSTVRRGRDWPDELVPRLQLIAGIFSTGLVRMRGEAEVQRLRRDLTHVGRVTTMGELTASLAHELRQPLTAILSNAETAQELLASGEGHRDELGEILSDIVEDDKRAGEVIRRLRSLLDKGELERQTLDLNEVIGEAIRLVQSDAIIRNMALDLELEPRLPPVLADRVQVQQVLLNLIMNGLEAMRDVGPADRRLVISTAAGAGTVRVSVRDRGPGIPPHHLSRILEPFYTTKPSGMGMGLSIARSIVEAHAGRLWAENNPERGAAFSFALPVDGNGHP